MAFDKGERVHARRLSCVIDFCLLTAPAGLTSHAFILALGARETFFWINKKLTFVRDYCPSGSADLILTRCCCCCCCRAGLLQHGHARRSQGDTKQGEEPLLL